MDAVDVVNVVNAASATSERVAQFKSAVEFFGAASMQVSPEWIVTIDFGHLLTSYNVITVLGTTEFTLTADMPSIMLHYVLADEGVYNVRVGAGTGYHFGTLSESYGTQDLQYTGKGMGMVADIEANTAFGEHLFAYLGANARWEFIGELTNGAGKAPIYAAGPTPPTLHLFGIGARLGFSYYF